MKINTPNDIDNLSDESVLDMIKDPANSNMLDKRTRLKFLKILFKVLALELSNDIKLALLSTELRKLIIATAGSGKTVSTQVLAILQKMCRKSPSTGKLIKGDKILCLVYNDENVNDIVKKHTAMVDRLYDLGLNTIKIDREIKASTMHKFCKSWAETYAVRCGLQGHTPMSDGEKDNLMDTLLTLRKAKKSQLNDPSITVSKLLGIYNFMRESLLDYEKLTENDKFIDMNITIEDLKDLFENYDKIKASKRKYDFTDMLTRLHKLLLDNEDVRGRIRSTCEFIIADEVQDFTPVMMEILRLIADESCPLVCVGDDDQSIYGFRGADSNNALKFGEVFEDSGVYSLMRNRRCPSNIVKEAKFVVGMNKNRFNKKILAVKPEGELQYIPYANTEGQVLSIMNRIMEMSDNERESTVICYRDRESSRRITYELHKAGIPFNILSGFGPYSHDLFRIVFQIIEFFISPISKLNQLNLYKCLPLKRAELEGYLHYNPKTKGFKDSSTGHFDKVDFGPHMQSERFKTAHIRLLHMLDMSDSKPMNTYMPVLLDMVNKYHWNYQKRVARKGKEEIDEFFEKVAFDYFNSDKTLTEFYDEHCKKVRLLERYNLASAGVTLSTFHSLKGLEFDNVLITNLNDEKFPNFQLIDSRPYPEEVKENLKECETRLMYVAMTRAKRNEYLYYDETNPSFYITQLLDTELRQVTAKVNEVEIEVVESINDLQHIANLVDDIEDDSNEVSLEDEVAVEDEFEYDQNIVSLEEDYEIEEQTVSLDDSIESGNRIMTLEEFTLNERVVTLEEETISLEIEESNSLETENNINLNNSLANLSEKKIEVYDEIEELPVRKESVNVNFGGFSLKNNNVISSIFDRI